MAGAQAPAEGQAVLRDGPKATTAWPHSARIQVGRAAGSSRGGPALLQLAPRSGTRHWRRRKQARQGAAGRFPREHVRLSAGLSRRSPPAGDARGVGGVGGRVWLREADLPLVQATPKNSQEPVLLGPKETVS